MTNIFPHKDSQNITIIISFETLRVVSLKDILLNFHKWFNERFGGLVLILFYFY